MAKRHYAGNDLVSQVRRCQELLLARTGLDEFYETIKLLVAKALFERNSQIGTLDYDSAQKLLESNAANVKRFVEGATTLLAPADVVNECLNVLQPTNLSQIGFEALDAAFEGMTSYTAKSDKGQFFTPRHAINFCIEVLRPQKGESICDPACGSAAFLHSAYQYMGRDAKDLYGFDISKRASNTASLMSYFACDNALEIRQLDSLHVEQGKLIASDADSIESAMAERAESFEGYDVIATNPPFAGDVSTADFTAHYETARFSNGKVERDVLFLERCVRLLKPGGRLGIVLPDNKISAVKFAPIRRWLMTQVNVVGIVSLHSNTFRPYTSQKAAVIFAQKPFKRPAEPNEILMYRSDKAGKTSTGSYVYFNGRIDHDLDSIREDLVKKWKL